MIDSCPSTRASGTGANASCGPGPSSPAAPVQPAPGQASMRGSSQEDSTHGARPGEMRHIPGRADYSRWDFLKGAGPSAPPRVVSSCPLTAWPRIVGARGKRQHVLSVITGGPLKRGRTLERAPSDDANWWKLSCTAGRVTQPRLAVRYTRNGGAPGAVRPRLSLVLRHRWQEEIAHARL